MNPEGGGDGASRERLRPFARDEPFGALDPANLLARPGGSPSGLSSAGAAARFKAFGAGALEEKARSGAVRLLLGRSAGPLVPILLLGAAISPLVHERIGASIILATLVLPTAGNLIPADGTTSPVCDPIAHAVVTEIIERRHVARRRSVRFPIFGPARAGLRTLWSCRSSEPAHLWTEFGRPA